MKVPRLSIGLKVLLINALFILLITTNGLVIYRLLSTGNHLTETSSRNLQSSLDLLEDFMFMVTRSQMLTTNWVYFPQNANDKESLRQLHALEFPELKDQLSRLKRTWKSEQIAKLDSMIIEFDAIITSQKKVTQALAMSDDYADYSKNFEVDKLLKNKILPGSYLISDHLDELAEELEKDKRILDRRIQETLLRLGWAVGLLVLLLILFAGVQIWFNFRYIIQPIQMLTRLMTKLGRGQIPQLAEQVSEQVIEDEIGDMILSLDRLVKGLRSMAEFAKAIGEGNYQARYQTLSEHDILGIALSNMRDNLSRMQQEAYAHAWTNAGIARFSDILRTNTDSPEKFYAEVITQMVKYIRANQGGLFVLDDTLQEGHEMLKMMACYAWERPRHVERYIQKGEGLTGQVWRDGQSILLTEVPEEYVEISSGLGGQRPKSVLIVPIQFNDLVQGVIELASFHVFAPHEVVFVEKVCENLASTIILLRNNTRNQTLLHDAQRLNSQLRAQEDALMHQLERSQDIEEQLYLVRRELREKDRVLNATNIVLETDPSFNIVKVNVQAMEAFGLNEDELTGKPLSLLFKYYDQYRQLREQLEEDQLSMLMLNLYRKGQREFPAKLAAVVIRNEEHQVVRYVVLIDDLSEMKQLLAEVQR